MSFADDLLDVASKLTNLDARGAPRQATLRRAVSTAYYALFHLLVEDATDFLLAKKHQSLRDRFARVFVHNDMKTAAAAFSQCQVSNPWVKATGAKKASELPEKLVDVATLFVTLQEERHDADYNVARKFSRSGVTTLLARTEKAFEDWKSVKNDPAADAFKLALLGRGR